MLLTLSVWCGAHDPGNRAAGGVAPLPGLWGLAAPRRVLGDQRVAAARLRPVDFFPAGFVPLSMSVQMVSTISRVTT